MKKIIFLISSTCVLSGLFCMESSGPLLKSSLPLTITVKNSDGTVSRRKSSGSSQDSPRSSLHYRSRSRKLSDSSGSPVERAKKHSPQYNEPAYHPVSRDGGN